MNFISFLQMPAPKCILNLNKNLYPYKFLISCPQTSISIHAIYAGWCHSWISRISSNIILFYQIRYFFSKYFEVEKFTARVTVFYLQKAMAYILSSIVSFSIKIPWISLVLNCRINQSWNAYTHSNDGSWRICSFDNWDEGWYYKSKSYLGRTTVKIT